ncbi:protein-disulfide reductase DsbD [Alteromonas pelagimontana]|uniref:Thiol:disulfide interchange protein DsbD n=1 Tax=Alteromonas pelagimontana TaxID=1858656 RepID=A0A6M4MC48_9ALTE|nr:protein-disulfide reductase DsbD [Alteromonas pelagimontana]QJR80774.1 protein-disulfide reductase DsbD [Alteromonas pelagimontana]
MKQVHVLFMLLIMCIFLPFTGKAQIPSGNLGDLFSDEPEFLPVDKAFAFDYNQQNGKLIITFDIAEGYYLYKKQFKIVTKNATLGEPAFPPAEQKEDEFFGISDVYFNRVSFSVPIEESVEDGVVKIRYQGCAEEGLCYPPTTKVVYLTAVNYATESGGTALSNDTATTSTTASASSPASSNALEPVQSEQFSLAQRLADDENLAITLLLFLALGIGLAFTPCVFPMYPILSGIVLGQGKNIKLSRAFWLSFIYVQGMAITYSLLGLIVASAGVQFQAALQHPFVLGVFIVLFVALALAMFGAYELQLPSTWQSKLNSFSNTQKRGNTIGVFVMGVLSGLVASPCTTAPLTGILLFIAQTGDMVLGFVSLYVLSLGMGIPLVLFGMTGGKLLPKAGNWMNIVKTTFGFMMLSVAILFVERLWNNAYSNLLWSALGLATFSYFAVMNQNTAASLVKGIRLLIIFVGLFASAMVGYTTFYSTPFAEQENAAIPAESEHPTFIVVKSLEDFDTKLATANAQGKSVMVDLYADWCVACKEFEKYTFPATEVKQALANTVWMQIDLTDNTVTNQAFQERFDVLGLPTILFFDNQGNELKRARVTGFMRAAPFAAHVNQVLKN